MTAVDRRLYQQRIVMKNEHAERRASVIDSTGTKLEDKCIVCTLRKRDCIVRLDMECGRGKFKCSYCLMSRNHCSLSDEPKYMPRERAAALGRKLRPLEFPTEGHADTAVQSQESRIGGTDKDQVPLFAGPVRDAATSEADENDMENMPARKRRRSKEQAEESQSVLLATLRTELRLDMQTLRKEVRLEMLAFHKVSVTKITDISNELKAISNHLKTILTEIQLIRGDLA